MMIFCLPLREETLAVAKDWVEKLRSSNSSSIPGVLLAAKANKKMKYLNIDIKI